ncbi:MAG: hypothetical protein ACFB00_09015 [Parvularculaceae bacterium]
MTIICAVYDPDAGKFWLGCNSGSLVGDTIIPEHRTKWLRFANWAIAFSGSGVADDALETERGKFPNQATDVHQVTAFIRASFERYDLGEKDDGAKDFGVSGLIAQTGGMLYDVDGRLSLGRIPEGTMWARGSGMDFALGADMAMKTKGFGPQERLETAVLTAIDLDSGCPGEPIVESFG